MSVCKLIKQLHLHLQSIKRLFSIAFLTATILPSLVQFMESEDAFMERVLYSLRIMQILPLKLIAAQRDHAEF